MKPNTPCREWAGPKRSSGYGAIWFNGKCEAAHRAQWMGVYGPIPRGMCVCHRCDNRACVRIDHLFLGTHKDNAQDKVRKYRWRGNEKLTQEQIQEIRASKLGPVALAKKFGVHRYTIWAVRAGRRHTT